MVHLVSFGEKLILQTEAVKYKLYIWDLRRKWKHNVSRGIKG